MKKIWLAFMDGTTNLDITMPKFKDLKQVKNLFAMVNSYNSALTKDTKQGTFGQKMDGSGFPFLKPDILGFG